MTLRIMPLGDSITRGSYLALYDAGPLAGKPIGLPNPAGGGWRKPLQDKLRAAGVAFEFVGELDYDAYGHDGVVDPAFSPRHHGLAGFGNHGILTGGVVPTPQDVLEARKVAEIRVPDIVTVLGKHKPDIILLMSGANGFDASARERLVRSILSRFSGRLLLATIPPQCLPRPGCEQVEPYNAALPTLVKALQAEGHAVTLVDVHAALTTADLLPDGVHPNADGMRKIAEAWWFGLQGATIEGLKQPGVMRSRSHKKGT
jgi:lysophospholipase L1-like esterase